MSQSDLQTTHSTAQKVKNKRRRQQWSSLAPRPTGVGWTNATTSVICAIIHQGTSNDHHGTYVQVDRLVVVCHRLGPVVKHARQEVGVEIIQCEFDQQRGLTSRQIPVQSPITQREYNTTITSINAPSVTVHTCSVFDQDSLLLHAENTLGADADLRQSIPMVHPTADCCRLRRTRCILP